MPTLIPPSTTERWIRCTAYLAIGSIGVWVAFQPSEKSGPLGMSAELGHLLSLLWAAIMATALPAAAATAVDRYRIEFCALPWFGSALVLATGWTWMFVGPHPMVYATACIATALCLFLAARYWGLWRIMREAMK